MALLLAIRIAVIPNAEPLIVVPQNVVVQTVALRIVVIQSAVIHDVVLIVAPISVQI